MALATSCILAGFFSVRCWVGCCVVCEPCVGQGRRGGEASYGACGVQTCQCPSPQPEFFWKLINVVELDPLVSLQWPSIRSSISQWTIIERRGSLQPYLQTPWLFLHVNIWQKLLSSCTIEYLSILKSLILNLSIQRDTISNTISVYLLLLMILQLYKESSDMV